MADDEDNNNQPSVYEDDEQEGGLFRWMSALVVVLAIAGFFGLAWYAYHNGGDTVDENDVELIKADKTPMKEAPANPGGMQIPNQDKTVYGLISGTPEKPVVERILPAPEEPIARGNNGGTTTWMSDSAKNKTVAEDATKTAPTSVAPTPTPTAVGSAITPSPTPTPAPTAPKEQFNPAKAHSDTVAKPSSAPIPAMPTPTPSPVPTPTPSPSVAKTPSQAIVPKPTPTPAAVVSDDSDDVEDSQESKPKATKASAPPAGVRVQLGAYKSQVEAESNWTKIAREFADEVKDKQHYVLRADLGDKGIFYRLQLAPFDNSEAADQFCIDFVSAGQGCIATKGK